MDLLYNASVWLAYNPYTNLILTGLAVFSVLSYKILYYKL